jgi:hypothetical protein
MSAVPSGLHGTHREWPPERPIPRTRVHEIDRPPGQLLPGLSVAGEVCGLRAYQLLCRVEDFGLSSGDSLVIDVSGATDIDVESLAALRQTFEVLLWQGISIELQAGSDETRVVASACRRLLTAAYQECDPHQLERNSQHAHSS